MARHGALGHVPPPWSLRMHANFADLRPDGFHFWMTVTTNFGTRAPRARAPWSKILATPRHCIAIWRWILCEAYLEQGLVVTDTDKLRRNYVYTWQFAIDIVSLLPTDLLYLSHTSCQSWLYTAHTSSCHLTCPPLLSIFRRLLFLPQW